MSRYVPQAEDVGEAVDRALFDRLRAMTPLQRLELGMRTWRTMHRVQVAGLRLRFPDASEAELSRRAAVARAGPELLSRLLGESAVPWSP